MTRSKFRAVLVTALLCTAVVRSTAQPEERYHSHAALTDRLRELVASHSSLAALHSIGTTSGKREIWCVTVCGKADAENPSMFVAGGIEADRLIGSELALRFLEYILTSYGRVDSITRLVDSTTLYIVPRVSPDASEAFFASPLVQRSVNIRPNDDDRDGAADEDGCEDLNGDGVITMMRIRDDRGEWIPHPGDPRIMRKANGAKGERGRYQLYTEGIDNDKDDRWNEDPPGGTDFDRNFPHRYAFFTAGSGPYQVSEPETRAVADFLFAHPEVTVIFSFSDADNLMNPWKKEPTRPLKMGASDEDEGASFVTSILPDDEPYFTSVSTLFKDITHYTDAPASQTAGGNFVEWAYYHFGRWSFAANPWWIPNVATPADSSSVDTVKHRHEKKEPKKTDEPAEIADELKAMKWFDQSGRKDAFVPWSPVRHTDFPDRQVEVGGFRPYVLVNPPPDSIRPLAARFNIFLSELATKMPRLAMRNVKVEKVDDRVYRLTLDVFNDGYLPTNSAMGVRAGWPRDVKVTLHLSGDQKLVSGKGVNILDPISGSSARKELTWLILAKAGSALSVHAESPMSGTISHEIVIQ